MSLEEFAGRRVNAGEPVTADGWNEIVDGIRAVNDHVRTAIASAVAVKIGNVGIDPAELRVTANSVERTQVYEAVQDPEAASTVFVFSDLPAGVYNVRAAAPGFQDASQAITSPDESEISLTLLPRGSRMPDLFGVPLLQGLKALSDNSILVLRVIDVTGREVAPAKPDSDDADSPILVQIPGAGAVVPESTGVSLAIAAALREEPSVEMPSLSGLTLAEARKALESIGLALGDVVTKKF